MTRKNYTDIVFVIDRSGSMGSIKVSMEDAINELVSDQKRHKGVCRISTYLFDTHYNYDTHKSSLCLLCQNKSVTVGQYKKVCIEPRGMTPLYDAVCTVIKETGNRYNEMAEYQRPSKVLFVIVTDGLENMSREYTQEDVQRMVKEQTNVYNWTFMYLGANQDAIVEGEKMGIHRGKSLTYRANKNSTTKMSDVLKGKFANVRAMSAGQYEQLSSGSMDLYSDSDRVSVDTN